MAELLNTTTASAADHRLVRVAVAVLPPAATLTSVVGPPAACERNVEGVVGVVDAADQISRRAAERRAAVSLTTECTALLLPSRAVALTRLVVPVARLHINVAIAVVVESRRVAGETAEGDDVAVVADRR